VKKSFKWIEFRMEEKNLKILVVDDSAFMRKFIGDIIQSDSEMELVGTARNGEDALRKIAIYKPDVITLDVEMPGLNGLDTLKRIMEQTPLPVIMVSSLTQRDSKITIEALAAGAIDFITKPSLVKGENAEEIRRLLPLKIKAAAGARLGAYKNPVCFEEKLKKTGPSGRLARKIVAIGASTGGPRALEEVLKGFPADLPAAVLITQHMPAGFTDSLSKRLDRISPLRVEEAANGESILESKAYVAPGGFHLLVTSNGTTLLSNSAPVNYVRPSADLMMETAAEVFGPSVVGVVLTGMGRDGAEGMARIKEKGGKTVVQDPNTAVIPGMPQAVIKRGSADMIVSLERVAAVVTGLLK
jgi:two-component system chemotaxis response regulator CheB